MGRKERKKCKIDGAIIEVGKRSIHLLEKHNYEVMMPSEKWLRDGLPILAEAVKKGVLRKPPFEWMSQYFDFDP
mgnify:CR=1 FL=1